MALINWNESLTLGFDSIDTQHQKLVAITNELHDSMLAGKSRQALGTLLTELVAYTQSHFNFEEQLFRTHSYPLIAKHTAEHTNLTKQVLDFKARFESGTISLSVELMEFLRNWLAAHISGSDRVFVEHLNGKRSASLPR